MGMFSFLNPFKRSYSGAAIQSSGIDPGTWLWDYIKGDQSTTTVNLKSALSLSAFYSCIKIFSETISVLPFQLMERDSKGNEKTVPGNWLYQLVHDSPNNRQTSFTYTQTEATNTIQSGNSYARIIFDKRGRPADLDLLIGGTVKPFDSVVNGQRKRFYKYENHQEDIHETYFDWEILHLMNFSFDGLMGVNPIEAQKESLKRAISGQKYGNNYFENGTHNGGTLETEKRPPDGKTKEFTNNLLAHWNKQSSGIDKAGQPVVLWDGFKFNKTADNLQDSMLLDVLKMSVPEIARCFRIPIEMLDSSNRANSTKQEEIMLQLRQGILPFVKMREAEYNKKLIPTAMRGKWFFKHNLNGLLRGDNEAQSRLLEMLFKTQSFSPDDILKSLGLPPRKDGKGDQYGLPFASNIKTEVKSTIEKKSAAKLNGVSV